MKNFFDFLNRFQRMQYKVEYDSILNLPFASIAFTQSNPSPFANYALVNRKLTSKEIQNIESEFAKIERRPCIYFVNDPQLEMFENIITYGYEKKWEDSWMFYEDKPVDLHSQVKKIKEINTPEMLELFLNTFDSCYQKDDPQNPYGEVKDYIINCRKAWLKFWGTTRLKYFLVYEDNVPVATSILDSFEGMGYISGVGSLVRARGKGYGKLATLYAVDQSIRLKNTEHVLATEEGTYPNEFYKRIGFTTRFTALGLVKK